MSQSSNRLQSNTGIIAMVAALTAIAIASRFLLVDWPNFKPVCAIAIFLGFVLPTRRTAMLAISIAMLVSDFAIGFYEWPIMAGVYGSMLLACCIGFTLQRLLANKNSTFLRSTSIGIAALIASTIFFLVSNTVVWLVGWYPSGFGGLVQSLAAGVPFFKFTLVGNLCFTFLLFASYFAIQSWNVRLFRSSWATSRTN